MKPNFLLFMPETLRADAVFGPPAYRARTPHLDHLAAEGASLTHCFAQNPICSPSRCSMFSGLYPHTWGQRSLLSLLQPHQRNLFRDLKDAGYRNVVFGKNDLLAQASIPLCFDETACRVAPDPGRLFEPPSHPPGSRWERSFYWGRRTQPDCHDGDWACIESALRFLDEPRTDPFCLYLPLNFAHPPYRVEEPFFSMHALASIPEPIPPVFDGKRSYMPAVHNVHGLQHLSVEDLKEIKRVYFGMVSRVDHQLGLLVQKLKARGLYDNTVIAVFSDHGDYAGDFGMVEKFLVGYEDCLLHVPIILRGPGVNGGSTHSALCEMTDLYPTLLELAGIPSQHSHFGRSLGPLIRGTAPTHRTEVFAEAGHRADECRHFHVDMLQQKPPIPSPYQPMGDLIFGQPDIAPRTLMIRTEQWKYVYAPDDRDELFDLRADPRELVNLADRPAQASVVAHLRERLLRWMLHTADVLPAQRDPRGWRNKS